MAGKPVKMSCGPKELYTPGREPKGEATLLVERLTADYRGAIASVKERRHAEAEQQLRSSLQQIETPVTDRALRLLLARILNLLGVVLRAQGEYLDAISYYERALLVGEDNSGVLSNLGNALRDSGHALAALEAQRAAIALAPGSAMFNHNIGICYANLGRFEDALLHYDRALALQPDYPIAAWDRARVLLHIGDYAQAWPAYEARWALPEHLGRRRQGAEWDGRQFAGRRLFLYGEQGFGDTIQCARYLPQVKALGGTVILECQPPLISLMEGLGADFVVPRSADGSQSVAPEHDLVFPLLSLPRLFSPTVECVPSRVPYLRVPGGRAEKLRDAFRQAGSKLKVGIVWSGSVTFKGNRERAIRLAPLLHALAMPGVQLYSLQKGPPEVELRAMNIDGRLIDLAPLLGDFADTAAAVEGLDLVVMTDSAVAHLAGALGRPVWVLVSFVGHWLWMRGRDEDNPWYPTMRIFRQSHPGEWGAVLDRAREELAAAAAGDRSRLASKR